MTSAIDPSFITTSPVSKALMRTNLGYARDEITALQNKVNGIISVYDFGAVGDGVTDDTAAIQNAINAVSANGGVVFFGRGRFKTSYPLEINEHCVTLRGTTLGQNGSVGSQITGSANHNIINHTTIKSFFSMENLALEHPSAGHTVTSSQLNLVRVSFVDIRNCYFRNIWNGITMEACDNIFINNIEVRNTRAISGTSWGISMTDTATNSMLVVSMSQVRLYGINTTAGSVGLIGLGTDTVYASQIAITKWETAVKLTTGAASLEQCQFWRFVQCETENCGTGFWLDDATRVTMLDCQASLSDASGFRIGPTGGGQVDLTACHAFNNGEHGFILDTAPTGSYSVTGCVAAGNSQDAFGTFSGLCIASTSNVTVTGGRFGGGGAASVPGTVTHLNGIRVQGAGTTGITITGANLEGNTIAYANGATDPPVLINCKGFPEAFKQVRTVTSVNYIQLTGSNTGVNPNVQAAGTDTNVNLALGTQGTGQIVMSAPVLLPVYAKAALPAVLTYQTCIIMVADDVGGRTIAFSDGTNWRRVEDRAIIS